MIICAGNAETFPFATSIGIGLIESTIGLTQYCLFNRPDHILFIGSAGSYGAHDLFDIIESRTASNIELSFLENNSYTPLDNVLHSDNTLTKNETIVNSSNYISTNATLNPLYLNHKITLENMEFFALVQVAKQFGIPIGGIFIVTNYTNKEAHQDFKQNHEEAKTRLAHYLLDNAIIKDVSRETN